MGHDTHTPIKEILAKHPDRVIEKAVFGMLPKNSLAKQKMRTKLKVFAGADHPHAAQMPQPYAIGRKAVKVTA
jgi:large subunit ribosomal protein L13